MCCISERLQNRLLQACDASTPISGMKIALETGEGESDASYAGIFLVIADYRAIFGFGGIASSVRWIAKVLFYIFLAIFIISLCLVDV